MSENLTSYKTIFKIASPLMLSRIPEILFFAVSAAFLGNFSGKGIESISTAVVFFLAIDTFADGWVSSMIQTDLSKNFQLKKDDEIRNTLLNSFSILVPLSIILFLVVRLTLPAVMNITISDNEIKTLSSSYISIRCWGIPLIIFNYIVVALIIARGKTNIIPIITLLQVAVTFGSNYYFVSIESLGIKGTAISTLIAELTGCLAYTIALVFLYKRKLNLKTTYTLKWQGIKKLLNYNLSFRNTFSIFFWYLFFAIVVATGQLNAAVSGVVKSIFSLMIFTVSPFKTTIISLISKSIAAEKYENVGILFRRACFANFILVCSTAILIYTLQEPLLNFYLDSSRNDIKSNVLKCLVVLCLTIPFVESFSHILSASLNALKKRALLLYIDIAVSICYVLFAYVLAITFKQPIQIIWLAEPFYAILNIIIFSYFFKKFTSIDQLKLIRHD